MSLYKHYLTHTHQYKLSGFVVQFIFFYQKNTPPYLKVDYLERRLLQILKGFEVMGRPRVDHTIRFLPTPPLIQEYPIISKTTTTSGHHVLFYRQMNNEIITFLHISVTQLIVLITQTIQELLYASNGFYLHASAVLKHNKAYVFTGESGDGKSTVARMLRSKDVQLADEYVCIRKKGKHFFLYQTHFMEKTPIAKNTDGYPISGVIFLSKKQYSDIEKIRDKKFIYTRLISQIWINKKITKQILKTLHSFIEYSSNIFYILHFRLNKKEVVNVLQKLQA